MIEINKDAETLSIVQSCNIRDVLKLFLCAEKNWGVRFSRIVRTVLSLMVENDTRLYFL